VFFVQDVHILENAKGFQAPIGMMGRVVIHCEGEPWRLEGGACH